MTPIWMIGRGIKWNAPQKDLKLPIWIHQSEVTLYLFVARWIFKKVFKVISITVIDKDKSRMWHSRLIIPEISAKKITLLLRNGEVMWLITCHILRYIVSPYFVYAFVLNLHSLHRYGTLHMLRQRVFLLCSSKYGCLLVELFPPKILKTRIKPVLVWVRVHSPEISCVLADQGRPRSKSTHVWLDILN